MRTAQTLAMTVHSFMFSLLTFYFLLLTLNHYFVVMHKVDTQTLKMFRPSVCVCVSLSPLLFFLFHSFHLSPPPRPFSSQLKLVLHLPLRTAHLFGILGPLFPLLLSV